ncbi:MAG TPA: hypothetical protein VMM15_26020 [Bradyrhizobium sp.]|nr:hypothetical protein [Bradyrhizobium sp.]
MQQALRWFVDNVNKIADWRASLLRVVSIRETLMSLSTLTHNAKWIAAKRDQGGKLAFENFTILLDRAVACGIRSPRGWKTIGQCCGERSLITSQGHPMSSLSC